MAARIPEFSTVPTIKSSTTRRTPPPAAKPDQQINRASNKKQSDHHDYEEEHFDKQQAYGAHQFGYYQPRDREHQHHQKEQFVHQQSSRDSPSYETESEDQALIKALRMSLEDVPKEPNNPRVSFDAHYTRIKQEERIVDRSGGRGLEPLYPRPDERQQLSMPKTIQRQSTTIGAAVQEFYNAIELVACGNFDAFDFEKAYNLIFNLNKVKNEMSVERVSRDIERKKKELEDAIRSCEEDLQRDPSMKQIIMKAIKGFHAQLAALEEKSSQKDDLLSVPLDTSYYTRYKDGEKEKEKPRHSKAASSAPPPPPNPRQALDPRVPNPGGKMDTEEILIMEDTKQQLYVRAYKVTHTQLYTMRPESLYGKYVTHTGRELYWYQGQSRTNENFYIDVSAAIGSGILADHTLYGADGKTLERPRLQSASTRDPNVKYISTCRNRERCPDKDCVHDHSTNVRTDYNWIRNVDQVTSSTTLSPFPLLEIMDMKKKDVVSRHMMTRDAAVRVLLINAMFGHKDFTVKPKYSAERSLRSLSFKTYRDPVEHDTTEYEDY
jgi:hypothetical protein